LIGLPSLRDLDHSSPFGGPAVRIGLCVSPIDMRLRFDRLAELASGETGGVMGEDPLSGHSFALRARGEDRLKLLYWDRNGLALRYKRLEEGTFNPPPAQGRG